MRLKFVPGAHEAIEASEMVLKDLETYRGNFKSVFKNEFPIHIEIGMGKGSFIIEMAKRNPNINFIGIEKYDSVLIRALEKIEEDIPNLRFIRMDATSIDQIFYKEIDVIYLNFSDPWPKTKHAHRRLSSPIFLKRYDTLFKDKKEIIMKTDNRKLFEYSLISFNEYGYHFEEISLDLYNDDIGDNVATEYETKFHNLGFPIYKIKISK